MSSQTIWKKNCNRTQRRSNKQVLHTIGKETDDPKQVRHYSKTKYGDLWTSPNDGFKFRSGRGHDKRKPWRD